MTAESIVASLLEGQVGGEVKMDLPRLSEIVSILRRHPLFKLRLPVKRGFLVGSFAGEKSQAHSDVDVLLEVDPQPDMHPMDVETHYRRPLMRYFMKHDIRGQRDDVHPQWNGRRLDVYFTYDADEETRPKIQLPP